MDIDVVPSRKGPEFKSQSGPEIFLIVCFYVNAPEWLEFNMIRSTFESSVLYRLKRRKKIKKLLISTISAATLVLAYIIVYQWQKCYHRPFEKYKTVLKRFELA